MSFRPLGALIRKDVKVYLSDRRAVLISFVLPPLFSLVFGLVFKNGDGGGGDAAQAKPRVPIVVTDQDRSPASQRLVAALAADPSLVARDVSLTEANDLVKKGKVSAAVVLPAGFADRARASLLGGGKSRPQLTFILDPARPIETQLVRGLVRRHVTDAVASGLGAQGSLLMQMCGGVAAPFVERVDSPTGGDTRWNGASHAVAGMGVQFILMGSVELAVGILTDRQRGLWKRLMAAPLSRRTLLLSKVLSGALIALATLLFLYAFARFALGVRVLGSPLGFALVTVGFALMTSALGLMISTLARSPQAARGVGIFVVLTAVLLGGAWMPLFLFPGWLQKVSLAMPTRWVLDGLDAMTWRGLPLPAALVPAAVLLATAAVFGAIAWLRFRWEE
jgi:ABC-2 family transporter